MLKEFLLSRLCIIDGDTDDDVNEIKINEDGV
jgi:hypothetical protein